MNAAGRAFVRLAMSHGYGVISIRYGFDGLVKDNVSGRLVIGMDSVRIGLGLVWFVIG